MISSIPNLAIASRAISGADMMHPAYVMTPSFLKIPDIRASLHGKLELELELELELNVSPFTPRSGQVTHLLSAITV